MLKLYLVLTLSLLLCNFSVGVERKAKEKIYYKHTESTAADEPESVLKDEIPIVIEGKPTSSESVKLNSAKINLIKEIVKKGSKTVPKKGVLNKLKDDAESSDIPMLNYSSVSSKVPKTNISDIILQSDKPTIINSSKMLLSTEKSSAMHVAPVKEIIQEEELTSNVIKTKTTKKPKPKPEVTVGEKEADEPIPATPTIKSPLGMPRKIDYIVPVAITTTALPLLGVAFYILYKRGRDYWDKRHYRRMDFLIDGMYNE